MIVLIWWHVYYRSGWLWEMTKVAQRWLAWLYITFAFDSIILLSLQIVCSNIIMISFVPFRCFACDDSEKICRFPLRVSKSRIKHWKAVSKFSKDFSKAACGHFLPSSYSLFWEEERRSTKTHQNISLFAREKIMGLKKCGGISIQGEIRLRERL